MGIGVPQTPLPSTNGVAALISSPRNMNVTSSGERPQDVTRGG
jgi:hypothetical protein